LVAGGAVKGLSAAQSPENIVCPTASADTFHPPPFVTKICEAWSYAYPAGDGSAATLPSMPPKSRRVR
jgi:hypothetical protein